MSAIPWCWKARRRSWCPSVRRREAALRPCYSCPVMRLFRHPNEVTPDCRGAAIALGNFDGVHRGHQAVIARAFELGQAYDSAVGILTFAPHPRAFFKPALPP